MGDYLSLWIIVIDSAYFDVVIVIISLFLSDVVIV